MSSFVNPLGRARASGAASVRTTKPRIHKGDGGWWIVTYPSGIVDHAGDWDIAMDLVASYYSHTVTSTNDLVAYRHA